MKRVTAIMFALLLSACGGTSGGNQTPPVQGVDPVGSNVLQFAVGIATISQNNGAVISHGLNTVETLRQPDGLSGLLNDAPTITGPTTFSISTSTTANAPLVATSLPATAGGGGGLDAGADFGTNRISQATLDDGQYIHFFGGPGSSVVPTTATSAGAFGYGFCPCNSSSAPVNGTPQLYVAYSLPIYGGSSVLSTIGIAQYYGGPPAFPAISPEIAQAGFTGYSMGFTDFAVAPALGSYSLTVAIPPDATAPNTNPGASLSATAQLTSLGGLPLFATPAFQSDGNGGGSVAVSIPAGAMEALVFVQAIGTQNSTATDSCTLSHASTSFYTIRASGIGAQSVTLPDTLGPPATSGAATPTLCHGQSYAVYAAGFDYPAFEAAYPQNVSQSPVITSTSGQADITTSDALAGTYP
ncbi:MAG: hypothetical protein JO322_11070 [Candidatus Eremiobacteraeota bacterium]|nr:hypothetical protein [Candidatus Eremiobacteraeota bacterium]